MTADALTTFTLRRNAVRKAKDLIANGQAPSDHYTVERVGERFAIFWKTAATPEELEAADADTAEARGAAENNPPAMPFEPDQELPNPFPDGTRVIVKDGKLRRHGEIVSRMDNVYWRVQIDGETGIVLKQEPDLMEEVFPIQDNPALPFSPDTRVLVDPVGQAAQFGAVHYSATPEWVRVFLDKDGPGKDSRLFPVGDVRELTPEQDPKATDAEATPADPAAPQPKPVRGRGISSGVVGTGRSSSKNAALDAAAARGEMPVKPDITSPANQHYRPRFDKLEKLALAGDWATIEAFEVKGNNSYAKMLKLYRDRLITAHRAQQSKTEAA